MNDGSPRNSNEILSPIFNRRGNIRNDESKGNSPTHRLEVPKDDKTTEIDLDHIDNIPTWENLNFNDKTKLFSRWVFIVLLSDILIVIG